MSEDNPIEPPNPPPPQLDRTEAAVTKVFVGPHGVRAGWRLIIYIVIFAVLSGVVTAGLVKKLGAPRGTPGPMLLMGQEILGFGMVLLASWIMSRIERRSVGDYGLPAQSMFGKTFWLGFLFGLVEIVALMGLIGAFGGYSFGPLALPGSAIVKWCAFHLVLFTFVGFFEEYLFRGYLQFTLADGVGFWPAAILLSLAFGGVHLGNPGEGWVGAAGVVMVALLFCFSLKRTGHLWYAVGLHASFDYGETFLFSVPNSGIVMQGHLSNSLLHGPKWLTGGTVGPEGSVFCFLTLALQFLVVNWLFPAKEAEPAAEPVAVQS